MQTIQEGTRGLLLLVDLNWDRLFYAATILASLLAGAFIGSVIMGL